MPRAKMPRTGNGRKNGAARTVSAAAAVSEFKLTADPAELQGEIRARAYELYLERGCMPGHEHEDWLSAEREVLARHSLLSV